jgi:signal transduction histidine kinase
MRVRRTLFWKVAPSLVILQLTIVAIAAGFTISYARSAQQTLASAAMAARLDATAEEIERRSNGLESGADNLDEALLLDLSYRFPDPMVLLDLDGSAAHPIWPASDGFDLDAPFIDSTWQEPSWVQLEEAYDDVVIDLSDDDVPGGFASAPLYDEAGFPVGLLVVQPLTRSLNLELAESREAFRQSVEVVAVLAIMLALVFGGFLTWWMVRPIRRMATVVSGMGGDWQQDRVQVKGDDEITLLAEAINGMADRVAESIQSLRATDRMRRELVANVGHDLRTPLAGIRLHIEEASRFESEGRRSEAIAALSTAQRQIDHVSRMIDDLFELSRLEGDSSLLRLEPVLLAELVTEVVGMFASSAQEKGVSLTSHVSRNVPVLQADGTRLVRLLGNLVSNAIRHSPEGEHVILSVDTTKGSGWVELSVQDRGPGMTEEERSRLFDRYYRGGDARTRDPAHKRTGLGLAIARAVAEAHEGRLEVESEPGKGTIMRLFLPIPE